MFLQHLEGGVDERQIVSGPGFLLDAVPALHQVQPVRLLDFLLADGIGHTDSAALWFDPVKS